MTEIAGTESVWIYALMLGLLAGILSAGLGVGGGIMIVPALVLFLGYSQKSAQGISLAYIAPIALIGALRYGFHPDVKLDLKMAGILCIGGVIGANLGAMLAMRLSGTILRRAFACFMILAAIKMFTMPSPKPKTPSNTTPDVPVEKTVQSE